jgi:uracil-DNA glycosylase
MELNMDASWKRVLRESLDMPYFKTLSEAVSEAYASDLCYPPADQVFRALNECAFDDVKVVIAIDSVYLEFSV